MPTFSAKSDPQERRIAFVVFNGAKMLDITGPLQVFADANRILGWTAYTTTLASIFGGPIETDTGVSLNTRRLAGVGLDDEDTVIASGGDGVHAASRENRMIGALRIASGKCGRIGATCTGAFLLAAAGLLDNRRAVTHWSECARLGDEYPKISVDPDPIFIEDNGVWTSAGVTAGIDLALAMVEADHGRDIALELSRHLLVLLDRSGGQTQFSHGSSTLSSRGGGRFDALHLWMKDNLTADLRVEQLAIRSGMSPRNFARLYADETGETPAKMVEQFRIDTARKLLEDPDLSIRQIAQKCGFGSDERMRRSFVRVLGVSPQAYRQSFAHRLKSDVFA
ncbi:MAG: helix-turn-helix domain-containing protein [Alphaproteobacteria bacterium]|nr:helix-turn-helix domain-containing protein [Alphaproteobacteria bacterium]